LVGGQDRCPPRRILAGLAADGVDLALAGFGSADLDRILAGIDIPALLTRPRR